MNKKFAPNILKSFAMKRRYVVAAICLMFTLGISLPVGGFSPLTPDGPACPAQGSGAAGVQAFAAACEHCHNPATTCNGQFTIELVDFERIGDLVTFTYNVCRLPGSPAGLSHFVVGLGQIDCLGEGFNLRDLVVSCSIGDTTFTPCPSVGTDPTTQLNGIKVDVPLETETGVGSCLEFSFTLDESKLDPTQRIGVGCTIGATKAGNQDITRVDRPTPGYACINGPVCEERPQEELGDGCTPGYWKNHTDSWGPTGYSPDQSVGSVFANAPDPLDDATLLEALDFDGGPTLLDAKKILLRAAVAALLNASHPDVEYPRTPQSIIDAVNTALLSTDRDAILALKDALDFDNNLGCPLD